MENQQWGGPPTANPEVATRELQPFRSLAKPALAFIVLTALLMLVFSKVILQGFEFALKSNLYSHTILMPFVTGYLVWIRRQEIGVFAELGSRVAAGVPLLLGAAFLTYYWAGRKMGWEFHSTDYLAYNLLGFWCLMVAAGWLCFGSQIMGRFIFPVTLLVFAAPFPDAFMDGIIAVLQHGSADVAYWMLSLAGMPILRDSTRFDLPGISLEVAPQCSGIHSTLVLFIVSLIAGYTFLDRPWARAVLAFAVAPLALLRNGFRIFTIGQLCVQVHPDMVNSYIHRQGGPIFFALSLVPFLLLLLLLKNMEHKRRSPRNSQA